MSCEVSACWINLVRARTAAAYAVNLAAPLAKFAEAAAAVQLLHGFME